jgi:epoxide hydrolase-like predicted phosphatase
MIKAMIFDFGGVLVRTENDNARRAWDERLGLPTGSVERVIHHSDLWIQAQLGRITPKAYWDGVAEMLYMRREDIPELRRDYFSGDRLNYKLVALIRDLKAAGYGLALLSNDSIQLEAKLRDLEIDTLFDHVLVSALIGVMKPDPTAYRVALQALDVAASEAVFIDDSLVNVRAAQTLGIHTVLFRSNTDVRTELVRYLDHSTE